MKLHILNSNADKNVRVESRQDPDILEVRQECSDGSVENWTVSRADFLAAPRLPDPEAIPLVTVKAGPESVGGHWWLANSTYQRMRELLAA